MRNARKLAGIVAGVLAFSLVAAACGSDNNDSGSSGSTRGDGWYRLAHISARSRSEPIHRRSNLVESFHPTRTPTFR